MTCSNRKCNKGYIKTTLAGIPAIGKCPVCHGVPGNLDNPTVPGNAPAHTPGPWRHIPDDGTGTLPAVLAAQPTGYGNFYVAQCNVEADAVLCSAAPDLLAALETIFMMCAQSGSIKVGLSSIEAMKARAAITKAKGL